MKIPPNENTKISNRQKYQNIKIPIGVWLYCRDEKTHVFVSDRVPAVRHVERIVFVQGQFFFAVDRHRRVADWQNHDDDGAGVVGRHRVAVVIKHNCRRRFKRAGFFGKPDVSVQFFAVGGHTADCVFIAARKLHGAANLHTI